MLVKNKILLIPIFIQSGFQFNWSSNHWQSSECNILISKALSENIYCSLQNVFKEISASLELIAAIL